MTSSVELWREQKNQHSSIWKNFNSKINSKYKNDNLDKISSKKYQHPPFKKTYPYTIFSPPFYDLSHPPPPREANRIYSPHLKKRGPNYVQTAFSLGFLMVIFLVFWTCLLILTFIFWSKWPPFHLKVRSC